MKKLVFSMTILTLTALTQIPMTQVAAGTDYSIYDLQYQSDPEDSNSPHVGENVNCIGGIITHIFHGNKTKLTIQDPNEPNGWGGIIVKNSFDINPNVFDGVSVGDWISFTNVKVKESYGNTLLEYNSSSSFIIESSGNALPEYIPLSPNDITAPVYQTSPEGWLVANHNSEKYEAMLVRIENVIVTEKDLGKAVDNYSLEIYDGTGPNDVCWAADYMNKEVEEDDYHRFVDLDNRFCSVTGIIEQYEGYDQYAEIYWDYYQLLTTDTGDLKRFTNADLSGDCMVNMVDLAEFCNYWLWGTE
jgi:hypothetical protein